MDATETCKKQESIEPITLIKQEEQEAKPIKLKIQENWSSQENQKYALFLYHYQGLFRCQRSRRNFKVFNLLSYIIRSRTNKQCKSHHQKMMKRHKTNRRIIVSILGNIPKISQYMPMPEMFQMPEMPEIEGTEDMQQMQNMKGMEGMVKMQGLQMMHGMFEVKCEENIPFFAYPIPQIEWDQVKAQNQYPEA